MAEGYAKLLASIVRSSIWRESDATIRIWVTMLALADRNGDVFASIDGLAYQARKTEEETEAALKLFMAPDERSRSKELGGRRVVEIDGGWRLVNYAKIRDMHEAEASRARKRDWWNRHRGRGMSSDESLDELDALDTLDDDSTTRPRVRARAHRCDPAPSPAPTTAPDDPECEPRAPACAPAHALPSAPSDLPTASPSATHKSARRKRHASEETPMPEDWAPSEMHVAFAAKHGLDLELEVVKFRGHFDGRKVLSWNGRFSTWLGNAVGFKRERPSNGSGNPLHEKWGPGCGSGPQPNDPNNRYVPKQFGKE